MKHTNFIVTIKATKLVFLLSFVMITIFSAFANCNGDANAGVMPENENAPLTVSQLNESSNKDDFACNLFRTIYEQKKGSTIVSPISVGYVLGMLNEGAEGKTRQQITDVMGLGGSVKEINEYLKKMMNEAQSADTSVILKIANCIDVTSEHSINPQYKADMEKYYNAQVSIGPFDENSILNRNNSWCRTHTDGMIQKILDKGELSPNRVMYLLNAVYFKASWTDRFDPEETRDMDFTTLDGKTVKRPMMHLRKKAAYVNYNLCKMLRLPYGNKAYSMYVLLPNEGKTIEDVIQSFSVQKLKEWQSHMRIQDVDILMPRFTTESETPLKEVLSSMGMPLAFSFNYAEFPNMVHGSGNGLYVSMMKQKAKIEVSEKGTKAAAVTIAEVSEKGLSRHEIVKFHATRPFIYFIKEESTGSIFFMGAYCFDENGEQVTLKEPENLPEWRPFERPIEQPTKRLEKSSEEEIFKSVEQMPLFPGGDAALMKYLDDHINYPPKAACAQGRVVVQFVVDKEGKVGEVKVVRSVDKDLDAEAIRLVKTLPNFTPGRQNGQAVSVWYTLPVTFKLKSY